MKKTYFFRMITLILALGFLVIGVNGFGQNVSFLNFDEDDSFYRLDNSAFDINGEDYTIEAWIYPTTVPVVGTYPVIASREHSWEFYLRELDGNVGIGFIALVYTGTWDIEASVTSGTASLTLNTWHHVAVSSTGSRTTKLFIDGILVGSSTDTDFSLDYGDKSVNIGARYQKSNTTYSRYLDDCSIDEFRFSKEAMYTIAFTPKITDAPLTAGANTILLYHFNTNSGTSVTDDSGNGLNASFRTGTDHDPRWVTWRNNGNQSLPLADIFVWNGGDTDWGTTTNWDPGVAPTTNDDVIIPDVTNSPTIGAAATCNNLLVESGAVLTINADKALTVSGTLTNNAGNGGIVLKSTATEQGSLIHSTIGVDATVERQITQYSAVDDGWHLLSSPVNNFAIESSDFEPTADDDDLYSWDESTNYWINYHLDPGPGFAFSNFTNGQGYLCAYKTTATKDFTGKLNIADVTHTNMSAGDVRWHLLGNPFSSAIEWGFGTWDVTDVGIPQIYQESDGNYYAVNTLSGDAANIIPSTQGFVVRVVDNTNSITIPADARVHDGQDWYKQSKELDNTLKLKLSGGDNTFCDYTLLSFDDNATEEYDIEFDSYKFFGMPSAPQMYTLSIAEEEFSYNNIPTPSSEKIIPLNIIVPSEGEYTINVELNNMVLEGSIYLEDLFTTQLVNLSEVTAYSFQAISQNSDNRFMLHFNSTAGIDEDLNNQENKVLVYSNNNQIYIKSLDDNNLSGAMSITNIVGQVVYQQELNNGNQQKITTNLNTGIYIVSLKLESGYVISKKVIIK